jgi:ABC-type branched-subunit amino acid transport system ATPase component
MTGLLEIESLTKDFGGIRAVDSLTFRVREGGITGIIGPNGAGKTTVFNLITGVYRPTTGDIRLEGVSAVGKRPDRIVALGIARTFQNIRLFNRQTCIENVMTPLLQRAECPLFSALLRMPRARSVERETREKAMRLLAAMGIEAYADARASTLPYGLQRKLEIARALAAEPKLLLLDEPAAGMNPEETRSLADLIVRVHDEFGVSILLIEHHMDLVMNICSSVVVMNFGALLAQGRPDEIRTDERVIRAYLGKKKRERTAAEGEESHAGACR